MFWFEKYDYAKLTWGEIHTSMFREDYRLISLLECEQVPKSLTPLSLRLLKQLICTAHFTSAKEVQNRMLPATNDWLELAPILSSQHAAWQIKEYWCINNINLYRTDWKLKEKMLSSISMKMSKGKG